MKQLQEQSFKLEIYKIGNENLKQTVLEKLSLKEKFINEKYECKHSEKLLPRLQLEEQHISSVRALLDLQEETIKELKGLLVKSENIRLKTSEINNMLRLDLTEYMDKYFDLMLKK